MNEESIRAQLAEFKGELSRNEEEHEALLNLVKGLEGWLRIKTKSTTNAVLPMFPEMPLVVASRKSMAKGPISVSRAVHQVIKEARGEPLHVKEILRRVLELGAITEAKDKMAVVDLVAHSLRKRGKAPIERIGSRTWKWVGEVT